VLSDELEDEVGEVDDVIATFDEIAIAAHGVQADKQLKVRLNRAAYLFLQTTTELKKTCTPEDLVGEALLALLSGRRKWRMNKVDFPGLLIGAMKSLAWSRDKTLTTTMPNLVMEGELTSVDADGVDQPLDRLAKDTKSPDVILERREHEANEHGVLVILRAKFGPKEIPGLILDQMLLRQGYNHAEIRETIGVSDREYWNACKVLTRAVDNFNASAKED